MTSSSVKLQHLLSSLENIFGPAGFEIYPFKIGWYNESVAKPFHFDLDPNTLAFIIISTPDMFDKALVPFMCREECVGPGDLLDRCMRHYFNLAVQQFPDENIETMLDFEMTPTRRPKILVQPAAHVAGGAFYYTRSCLDPDPFDTKKKIFGVSIHRKYGGWFAIRGAVIFKSVQCPDLVQVSPVDCVPQQDKRAELLQLFNDHWQDWRYRDIIEPAKRYSENQKLYFGTQPKDRKSLVKELKEKYIAESSCGQ